MFHVKQILKRKITKMKIDELTSDKGFFRTISENYPDLYENLFDNSFDIDDLDLTFSFAYGNRVLLTNIDKILKVKSKIQAVEYITDFIVVNNSATWIKLKQSLESLSPLGKERTEKTSNRTDNTERSNDTTHSRSSFDSSALSDTDKDSDSATSDYTSNNHSVIEKTNDYNKSLNEYQNTMIHNKIFDIVAKDILSFIAFAIY